MIYFRNVALFISLFLFTILTGLLSRTGQTIHDGDDPILNAVTSALYKTLSSKGIDEDLSYIKHTLLRFIPRKKKYSKNSTLDVSDFDQCKIPQIHLKDSDEKVDYEVKIKEIKDKEGKDGNAGSLSYRCFNYEHVILSKRDGCIQIPSYIPSDDLFYRIEIEKS